MGVGSLGSRGVETTGVAGGRAEGFAREMISAKSVWKNR